MDFEFDDNRPIYIQLIDQFKIAIATNKYKLGEKLPSVREYAIQLRVNPNTINRALLELENDGLILTKRTSGKFITEDKKIIEKLKKELAKEKVNKFILDMNKLNISKKEIIELLKGE